MNTLVEENRHMIKEYVHSDFFAPHNIMQNYTPYRYDKGDLIYYEGDMSEHIYVVLQGKVKVARYNEDGEELIESIVENGELFGEMALFGEQRRLSYSIALEDFTKVGKIPLRSAQQLMNENGNFSSSLIRYIGEKARKLEQRVYSMLFKNTVNRVVALIVDLAEKGKKTTEGLLIDHSYTQKDMANLIGSSRQTVCKCLNELRKEGVIGLSNKKVIVYDLPMLKSYL